MCIIPRCDNFSTPVIHRVGMITLSPKCLYWKARFVYDIKGFSSVRNGRVYLKWKKKKKKNMYYTQEETRKCGCKSLWNRWREKGLAEWNRVIFQTGCTPRVYSNRLYNMVGLRTIFHSIKLKSDSSSMPSSASYFSPPPPKRARTRVHSCSRYELLNNSYR